MGENCLPVAGFFVPPRQSQLVQTKLPAAAQAELGLQLPHLAQQMSKSTSAQNPAIIARFCVVKSVWPV